jgi:hypothetical protein
VRLVHPHHRILLSKDTHRLFFENNNPQAMGLAEKIRNRIAAGETQPAKPAKQITTTEVGIYYRLTYDELSAKDAVLLPAAPDVAQVAQGCAPDQECALLTFGVVYGSTCRAGDLPGRGACRAVVLARAEVLAGPRSLPGRGACRAGALAGPR